MRSRPPPVIFALLVGCLLSSIPGCYYRDRDGYVYWGPVYSRTFTLTLVNDTSDVLIPGPVLAQPGDVVDTGLPSLSPGSSMQVVFGFLPDSITVGATTAGGAIYPTHTLELGVDYSYGATGATFVYQ